MKKVARHNRHKIGVRLGFGANGVGSIIMGNGDGVLDSIFIGETYLSSLIKSNMEQFVGATEKPLPIALPICREIARRDFLDIDSIRAIVDHCYGLGCLPSKLFDDTLEKACMQRVEKCMAEYMVKCIKSNKEKVTIEQMYKNVKNGITDLKGADIAQYILVMEEVLG